MDANRIFTTRDQVVSREIAGEMFLVPIRGAIADMQRIFALNPVGAHIWRQMDGTRTLGEIRDGIAARFDVTDGTAAADLAGFVGKLLDAGLITG